MKSLVLILFVLTVLKISGVLNLSWVLILSPLWWLALIWLLILGSSLAFIVAAVAAEKWSALCPAIKDTIVTRAIEVLWTVQILLMLLKSTGVIDWPWWAVTIPSMMILMRLFFAGVIAAVFKSNERGEK